MRWSPLAALTLLLGACVSELRVELPPLPAGAASAIVAVENEAGFDGAPDPLSVHAFAAERAGTVAIPLNLGQTERATVTVLAYLETLEAIQLADGPVPRATSARRRLLPGSVSVVTAELTGGRTGAWIPAERSALLASYEVDDIEWGACANAGGCYTGSNLCTSPCPTPERPDPPVAPLPPASPDPPEWAACPEGWSPAAREGVASWCAPPAFMTCPPDQVQLPGDSSCAPIGPECPVDGWPPVQVGPVFHVRPGASGDGSRDAPFGTIRAAVAAASPGAVIALAAGAYDEPELVVARAVSFAGACTSGTIVTGPVRVRADVTMNDLTVRGETAIEVDGSTAALDLQSVSIDGGTTGRVGVRLRGGSSFTGRRVVISGFTNRGVDVGQGSRVALSELAIRAAGGEGFGIGGADSEASIQGALIHGTGDAAVEQGGASTLVLADSVISGGFDQGVLARRGTVALRRVIVDGTSLRSGLRFENAQVSLDNIDVAGAVRFGIFATTATVTARDLVITDVSGDPGIPGYAFTASGSALDVARVKIARVTGVGFQANDGIGAARDLEIEDVRAVDPTLAGVCTVIIGATEVSRLDATDCERIAIQVGPGEDGTRLGDVTVRGATQQPAIMVHTRAMVDRFHAEGVLAGLAVLDGSLTAHDVRIDQAGYLPEHAAIGILGARLELVRAAISGCSGHGLAVSRDPNRPLDLAVLSVEDLDVVGCAGSGIFGSRGAVILERARFRDFGDVAVNVEASIELEATDVDIASGRAGAAPHPEGIRVDVGATFSLTQFRVAGAGDIGISIEPGLSSSGPGAIRLTHGEVSGNVTGLRVNAYGVDPRTLIDHVRFTDNTRSVVLEPE